MFTALVALLASFVLAPLTAQAEEKPKDEPKKETKSWTDIFKIGGSVRMRQQLNYTEGGTTNKLQPIAQGGLLAAGSGTYGASNWRPRFRVLLNMTATVDDFSAFVQLGTGGSPQSANADWDNVFPGNAIGVRQAYLYGQFIEKKLSVTIGQFGVRDRGMFASILTFDTDVAVVGAHFGFKVFEEKSKDKTDMALTINFLGMFLDNGNNIKQRVLGFAGSADFIFAKMFRTGLGLWLVTDTDDITGSTAFANLQVNGGRHAFQVGEFYFQADIVEKTLKAYLHALMNFGSPDKRRHGFLLGVTLFDAKEVGGVEADIIFYMLEQFAWAQGLSDADAGNGGTPIGSGTAVGSSGLELNWKWQVVKGLYIGMEINVAYLLQDQLSNVADHDIFTTMIFDVELKW
jgi:hypothetical protein